MKMNRNGNCSNRLGATDNRIELNRLVKYCGFKFYVLANSEKETKVMIVGEFLLVSLET